MKSNAEKQALEIKEKTGYGMLVETYVNSNTKAMFMCEKHGKFEAYPNNVKQGKQNCKKCFPKQNYTAYYEKTFADTQARSPYEIIRETYKGVGEKAVFICKEHGEFKARVQDVVGAQRQMCPVCVKKAYREKRAISFEEAQSRCEYEIVEYGGTMSADSILKCEKHGDFVIDLAHAIYRGQGCPVCGAIKRKETNLERYGNIVPAQSKGEIGEKARKGHSTSRKQEDEIYDLLCKYTGLEFEREQKYTPERKYRADFKTVVGAKTIFIEFHGDWTHGTKPYNSKDKECTDLISSWKEKSNGRDYYTTAIKQYTKIDAEKQAIAWANNDCLFLPFYSKQEVIEAFERTISRDNVEFITSNINGIVNYFQFNEKYKHEIKWFNESNTNKLLVYANRYKHHGMHKRLSELSDMEIINGIGNIAHFTPYYTGFSTNDLTEHIKKNRIRAIYDAFAGFGHRMIACAYAGVDYEACEINPDTYKGLCEIRSWLVNSCGVKTKISLYNADGLKHIPQIEYDSMYTCPPYYNREIYSKYGIENLNKPEFDKQFKGLLEILSKKQIRMIVSANMLHLFNGWKQAPYIQKKSHYSHKSKNITEWIVMKE